MTSVKTTPIGGQKPGTSGLRKKVKTFQTPHYLENYIQSIFNTEPSLKGGMLVIGGDGRYHNRSAIQIVLKMASANGVSEILVGQAGLFSTPAVSHIIRKYGAKGGIILSASHNPGGPNGDFGVKYNTANGGSASEKITDEIYAQTQRLTEYKISEHDDIDLDTIGQTQLGEMTIQVIDPVQDYAQLMESLFDFEAIADMIASGFTICFDAMHAITGPYAKTILEDRLGANQGSVINGVPLPNFGGTHPDPNPVCAKELFETMHSKKAPDFGAASDGDGDRNIILGKNIYVSPSDSLAILTANAHLAPAYVDGIKGVARSLPTSGAVDRVAEAMGIPCHVTPTGWKFFGNLLDAGRITLCGEESAGTSSDHIREKDGLWAVLLWLNIIAKSGSSVNDIVEKHWKRYGRNYYDRMDYEGIEPEKANAVTAKLENQFPVLIGQTFNEMTVNKAYVFSYKDPVDETVSGNQGWCVEFDQNARIVIRMSGTGTSAATLRVYIEQYEPDTCHANVPLKSYLENLRNIALNLTGLPS